MTRYLRYLLLAIVAIGLLTAALANRGPVVVQALPVNIAALLGFNWQVQMPLYLAVFGGIVAGILIGFVWEWFREHKHRATASTKATEVARLEREVTRLRETKAEPEDEVLALLAKPRKAG
jgi:putative membrane protein